MFLNKSSILQESKMLEIYNTESTQTITEKFKYHEVRKAVIEMLPHPVDLEENHNLIEFGIDSLRIIKLVNDWRQKGSNITFADLIKSPTLESWVKLLNIKSETAAIPPINHAKEQKHQSDNSPFPLTDVQFAYWVGREDGQPLGGVGCHAYLEIKGEDINVSRLSKAWNQVLVRHSMLRAKFLSTGEQEIMEKPFSKKIRINNFINFSEKEVEAELEVIRSRLSHKKLNVEAGEVIGLELSLLEDNINIIHLNIDLLVADVKSLQIIIKDLSKIYNHETLPYIPQYWSFSKYIRENSTDTHEKKKARLYWQKKITTMPGAPKLPLVKNPLKITSPKFKRRKFILENKNWEQLKKYSGLNRLTPAMVLLTASCEILDRWSTKSEFLINIPLFDRQNENSEIENTVADFTNLLLLAVDLRKTESFLHRAIRIQDMFHEDMANTAYSGVQVQRDLSAANNGDIMTAPFVFACNLGIPLIDNKTEATLGKLSYMISQTPQVWIDFQIYETDQGLLLAWDAVDALFPEGLVDEMFTACTKLIENLSKNTDYWGKESDCLPIYQQKIINKNTAFVPPKIENSLHSFFFKTAEEFPEKTAVIDSKTDSSLTYGELKEKALKIISLLQNHGFQKQQTVAVSLERGGLQIAAVLGILAAGGIYVPIGVKQPVERRKKINSAAQINITISSKDLIDKKIFPEDSLVLDIEEAESFSTEQKPAELSAAESAYIIFTSGSTGNPKGVEISHAAAVNTITEINRKCKITQEDSLLGVSALDFDLSVYDIFGILSAGGKVVCITEDTYRDPVSWFQLIKKHNITTWNSVPILMDMLMVVLESSNEKKLPLSHVMLSGDWIGLDLPKRIKKYSPDCEIIAMGGATEASIWSNYFDVSLPIDKNYRSIPYGKPLPNQTYKIVDSKKRDCPFLVPGELWIGGAGLARGYRGNSDLTSQKFINHNGVRWYKTGDLGRYLPDGEMEFLGRKDFQLKIRGHRIEPGEIEIALKNHPEINDTIVVAVSDNNQKQLQACIISSHKLEINDLNKYLEKKIPDYMIPSSYVFLDSLPLSPNGKPDRQALLNLKSDIFSKKTDFITAQTKTEKILTGIWSRILSLEKKKISTNQTFFQLGGNSLKITKVMAEIKKELDVSLPLTTLYQAPTISKLANAIDYELIPSTDSLIPIEKNSSLKTYYCFHEGGGSVLKYKELAERLSASAKIFGLIPAEEMYHKKSLSIEYLAKQYLNEIISSQNQEPYNLIGFCMGAYVAYETASLLEKMGKEVGELILINFHSYSEMPVDDGLNWLRLTLLYFQVPLELFDLSKGEFVEQLLIEKRYIKNNNRIPDHSKYLKLIEMNECERIEWIFQELEKIKILPPGIDIDQFQRIHSFLRTTLKAMEEYKPTPLVNTDIIYFKSNKEKITESDYPKNWKKLVNPESFHLHLIDGSHFTILTGENSKRICEIIKNSSKTKIYV